MSLIDAAKAALQEMLQDSGRRAPDDQPFLEVIAELRRAIETEERPVDMSWLEEELYYRRRT